MSELSKSNMTHTELESSKVTQDFNKAFQFLFQKAQSETKEDDAVDANMKQLSLKLLTR